MLPFIAAIALAMASAAGAGAAPPEAGILVEGRSLGGVHIGWTRRQVVAAWGPRYGRCRACARETLYFNTRPFHPQGAGVELRRGRVVAAFTIWSPPGWRSARGLRIGQPAARVTATYGTLPTRNCRGYRAIELRGREIRTVIAIVDDAVWGFALVTDDGPTCR